VDRRSENEKMKYSHIPIEVNFLPYSQVGSPSTHATYNPYSINRQRLWIETIPVKSDVEL
jgi:hypothetical protein